ncbi:Mbov_0398 family ICE element protein [Mesomycoplasma conjunctivae]|uniref:Mbov_0398 family ICE element protein n=1 Tax=Mesomycoplasma conjunctivae TaxID=45361 RepID=UPI003DA2920A
MAKKNTTRKETNKATLWLHYTDPKEVKLINKIKQELIENDKNPTREFKKFIIQSIESDSFAQSFFSIRQDIYYSLRKATFASLTPFYLKLIEMQKESFLNAQLLSEKVDFLINWIIDKPQNFNKFDEQQSLKLLKEINIFQQKRMEINAKLRVLKSKNRTRKKEILEFYERFLASEKISQQNGEDIYNQDEIKNEGDEDEYKNY